MTISSCRFRIILYFLLLPLASYGQEPSAGSGAEHIERIMEELSVEEKLYQFTGDLQEQFSQNPFGLPADRHEQMMDHFSKAFLTDTVLSDTRRELHRNYDSDYAAPILRWMENDTVQRVLDAQKEYYSIQGIRKRIISRYEMERDAPPEARVEVMRSLARKLSIAEREIESGAIIYRALVAAYSELNDRQSFSEMQIDGFVASYRDRLQSEISREITDRMLVMYRGVDSGPLKKYAGFYETEAGKWLGHAISASVLSAYRSAADRFLDSLGNP